MAIAMTEKAVQEVKRLITRSSDAKPLFLRLRVDSGGCSGFKHKLDLDSETNPTVDQVFEIHGVSVVVDRRSLMFLDGATVDFQDGLEKQGFRINNPNATSTCGCGSSFSM